jgi:hypothetical protein
VLCEKTLNVGQRLFIQENFFPRIPVVEDRNRNPPRTLPTDAPIAAPSDEGFDAVLPHVGDPLHLFARRKENKREIMSNQVGHGLAFYPPEKFAVAASGLKSSISLL